MEIGADSHGIANCELGHYLRSKNGLSGVVPCSWPFDDAVCPATDVHGALNERTNNDTNAVIIVAAI